ncbi:MAG TPA: T9SS type A sorting domain-containing protein, partial [Bacteroidia bacterium]|nr:T9SS type A sorting domain-containing protein [Bacteroidia bacterium]
WGGGGGGGGSTHTTQTDFSNGGGGGGGACSVNSSIPVTPGQVWTITIGAAGVGSTGAGGPGGTTTFVNGATTYSAGGGAGGTAGTTATGTANAGGAGGSTGTGTVHSGGTGSAGNNGTSNTTGITGTGGGAGGSGANGTSPASACSVTGTGGTGTYTGGNGGYEPDCGTSNNSSGTAGSVPGGGGSGNNDWSSATSGGAGGAGQVVIDISFTCTAPTTQSSVFTSSAITASSMTAGWTRGNGNDVLVLCSAGSACNTNPTSGTAYTANAVYGSGTGIGNAFVVYNGTGTSVNVTGLSSSTTYYYAIYEYNTLNNCYDLTADLTGNATTSPPAPPSTQASNLTFLNVDCQSMTISWTNGNGGGRYVVMNTSNTFTPPTNGTPPTTPNSVWANAGQQVVFDGNTSSVTVTSLSTSTLYWFKVYEYNGSGATINYSVAVGANNPLSHTSAGFVAAPTTSASGVNFSATACNQTTVAWTNGNGTGRIVVAKAGSAVAGVPVNGGAYTAASAFGLGSTIAAGEYVVYSGTGSNVTVTSLSASTTYYFAVFEDDGTAGCESYKTAAPGTNSVATPSCVNQIPYMTSAVINACPGSCGSEGANELLFFSSGSYAIPVNAANMVLTYGSAPAPTKIYNGVITANATITANLNAAAGCTGFFIDAVTAGTIPANTNFIMTSDTYCDGAYDFSSLCSSGYGPVYMVYADPTSNWYQVSGSPTGNYANAAGAGVPRYFRTDFSAVTGGGTSGITDYSYISSSLACDCDGATCTWGPSGGAPLVYVTPNSCTFPMIVLPIELASFTGTRTGKNVRLDWVTQTETNNAFFTLERSTNGTDFTYVAQVKGAGNSSSTLLYSYTDDGAPSGVCYYRLKQTDFNGDFTHSHDITVKPLHFFSVQSVYPNPATQQLNVSIEQESSNNMVVSVYNAEGKRVYMAAKTLTDKSSTLQIDLSDFPAGIYLLTVKGADTDYQSKFIKQ